MSKSLFCLVVFLLSGGTAAAQYPDDEYYPYAEREERRELLVTDSTLFYRAVQSAADLYGEQTDFNLPQVAFKRRGLERRAGRISFAGMDLSYRYLPALRLLGAEEIRYAGLVPPPGGSRAVRAVSVSSAFPPGEPLRPFLASVRLTDRITRGAKVAASAHLGRGWRASLALDARTGRDMHVEGVFTNALTVGLRLFRRFGGEHALSLVCIVPPSVRGTRLSSSEEAFTLTGDRLYNPAWGYQDGRVRNSRVRRETLPLLVADYAVPLSEAASLSLRLGAEAGVARYSMLDWYDARTPMPDNYRYLPSYTDDLETERAWLTRDPRYTQIDWDELIRRNRMQGGHAVYALDDRVERPVRLCLDAAFSVRTDSRLTLRCGVSLRSDRTRSYRQMRDLLGAGYVTDIDRYLVDADTYSNLLQNDLRHPDRTIREGDRFGYDYAIRSREIRARFCAEYRSDRFRFDLCAELGAAVRRRGGHEKELFPGALSYGPSRTVRFATWRPARRLVLLPSPPRSYLRPPSWPRSYPNRRSRSRFSQPYQPSYNNRIVDDPSPERTFAAEASWRRTGPSLDMRIAFAVAVFDGLETRRYYDDLAALFCDMSVAGSAVSAWGSRLPPRCAFPTAGALRWPLRRAATHIRDPLLTVLSDVDNTAVLTHAAGRMAGCAVGGTPQTAATAGVSYFGPKGWGGRLSAGYAGGRYVEPMPLRRTDRIAGQAALTPEAFDAFTRQERLADAFTLDASLFRTFYFDRSRLTASLLLRNLTGGRDTVYNGYESLRVRRIRSGDATEWMPHASRRTYAWPRSFYLTVSYRF